MEGWWLFKNGTIKKADNKLVCENALLKDRIKELDEKFSKLKRIVAQGKSENERLKVKLACLERVDENNPSYNELKEVNKQTQIKNCELQEKVHRLEEGIKEIKDHLNKI